ncbi:S9 family peptidase [Sphingomonas sp. So64.6b]|uniref:S9 family peptidase n=1 Tax=Sphingomonas sp. So64.6b TaxID=2997354 RepID=UPI001600AC46|nr:alpha/beta fold hydrolase [Sphingomonas sp. So64.6b]QNA83210.1 S9 family peptidase [Sphingomonas sp. So64.6b]
MAWQTAFRLIACAVAFALTSASTKPDDLAVALALPVAGDLTGARDATRFAWVENEAGVRNVWIADRGKPARQVTAFAGDDGQQLYDVALNGDGTGIAFVRGGDEEFPDGSIPNTNAATTLPKQLVFVGNADGAAPVAVGEGHSPVFTPDGTRVAYTRKGAIWLWDGTKPRQLASVAGQVSRLQWSPDGTRLLFVDDRDDHSFVGLLDIAGTSIRYLDPSFGSSVEPVFSPDGKQVAFIHNVDPPAGAAAQSGPYWSLRVADAASGVSRVVWSAPAGEGARFYGTRSRNLFWGADGQLVFPWERNGWVHPFAIDAAKGGEPRDLTPGAFEVQSFLLGRDGRSLIYAANAGDIDRRHIWRVPLSGGAPIRVTQGSGIESFPTLGGDTLAAIATDTTHPAHPVLAGRTLTPLGKRVEAHGFVTPEPVLFKAADGVEVHAQLFRARGPGKHSALIFAHGGPRRQMLLGFHPSGYYSNAYILNQHFAAQGYDVLAVNYRSGTGYGSAFRNAADTGRGGASEYRDILAAGRWLAAQPHVDPARIGIWGGSWGGYLTALALARNSDLFAAGVDFHGVHTMLRSGENNLSPDAQAAARQLQWSSSPMGAIDQWRSPVLVIHGDDDKNVDFAQSVLLVRELTARRIPFRSLTFPDERHAFQRYANWLASYRATDAFLAQTLMRKESLP